MDKIIIADLAVLCHIGVPDEERANPQRLLITVEIEGDFTAACHEDDIGRTVDYFQVCQQIHSFCAEHRFKLIERLAHELAFLTLKHPAAVKASVEVKKFILPETRYISCRVTRSAD